MKLHKIIFILCLIYSCKKSNAQELIWKDSIDFHVTGINPPLILIDEEANAFYVAAHQYEGQWNIILVKYDLMGNKEWERIIDFGWLDQIKNLKRDKDGNIYLQKNGWSIYKYNQGGELVWDYHYFLSDYSLTAFDFLIDDENEIYMAGRRYDHNDTTQLAVNAHVNKINENGELLWSKDFEFEKGLELHLGNSLNVFGDVNDSTFCIMRLTENGDSIDYNEFEIIGDLYFPNYVSSDEEGNFYSGAWFEKYGTDKITSNGEIEWSYEFTPQAGESPLRSYYTRVDEFDNVFLGGEIYGDSTYIDVLVTKLSSDGELIWETRYSSQEDSITKTIRDIFIGEETILATGSVIYPNDWNESYFIGIDKTSGELLYEKKLNHGQEYTTGFSILEDSNKDIYLIGSGFRDDTIGVELLDIYKYTPPAITTINEPIENGVGILYPNPVNNYLVLNNATGRIHIYDMLGKLIKKISHNRESTKKIIVENLTSGVYFISITHKDERRTFKFFKH